MDTLRPCGGTATADGMDSSPGRSQGFAILGRCGARDCATCSTYLPGWSTDLPSEGRITTMSTDDTSDFVTDDKHEAIDEANGITPAPVAESETQPIWARRTVLKAAALGTAAAALVSRGPSGL